MRALPPVPSLSDGREDGTERNERETELERRKGLFFLLFFLNSDFRGLDTDGLGPSRSLRLDFSCNHRGPFWLIGKKSGLEAVMGYMTLTSLL